MLQINLEVDGQQQYNVPFLITDLGHHDVILGRKWLAYLDLWLDVRNRQLIWPTSLPPTLSFVKEVNVLMESLCGKTIVPAYLADAIRRNRAFEKDVRTYQKQFTILRRPQNQTATVQEPELPLPTPTGPEIAIKKACTTKWTPRDIQKHTERIDYKDSLQKMEQELRETGNPLPKLKKPIKDYTKPLQIDICCIGPVGFLRNLKQPDTTVFSTSLYEIDRMIEQKEIEAIQESAAQEELDNEELIAQKLPSQYTDFKDVFSKAASDMLAPHRLYDLKITLDKEKANTLGFSPLYQHSLEELKACKQYLVENLHKGFIAQSQAPFAAPILFARKANGGLRFCVDYCKLNAITEKD